MSTRAPLAAVAALAALALLAPRAEAYPIPPRTLTSQVEQADLIVYAHVDGVERVEPREGDEGPARYVGAYANLRVKRVLKGEIEERQIRVPFSPGMICPAPPRYEEGELVLAFLQKDEALGWRTSGLSYGTLYPHPDELGAFSKAVHRAEALLARDAGPEEMRAFFVDLAVDPATRWHGLYELQHNAFLMSRYDQKRMKRRPLDPEEQHRLVEAFLASPRDDAVPMLRALEEVADPRLDATAARLAEELLERGASWPSMELLMTLADRVGIERPRSPRDSDEEIEGDPLFQRLRYDDAKSQRAMLAGIKKRVNLRYAAELPPPRAPLVPGVGGDTPP